MKRSWCKETSMNCGVPGNVWLDLPPLLVRDAAMIFHVTLGFIFLLNVVCVLQCFAVNSRSGRCPWWGEGGGCVSVKGQLLTAVSWHGLVHHSSKHLAQSFRAGDFGLSTVDFPLGCTQTPFPNHPENFKMRHSLFMEAPGAGVQSQWSPRTFQVQQTSRGWCLGVAT